MPSVDAARRREEVALLLRPPHAVDSPAAAKAASAAVEEALTFVSALDSLACLARQRKSRLFRALVEEDAQAAGSAFGGDAAEWAELVCRARRCRDLVRVKIQDDNDLNTARDGLRMCQEYFATVTVVQRA